MIRRKFFNWQKLTTQIYILLPLRPYVFSQIFTCYFEQQACFSIIVPLVETAPVLPTIRRLDVVHLQSHTSLSNVVLYPFYPASVFLHLQLGHLRSIWDYTKNSLRWRASLSSQGGVLASQERRSSGWTMGWELRAPYHPQLIQMARSQGKGEGHRHRGMRRTVERKLSYLFKKSLVS